MAAPVELMVPVLFQESPRFKVAEPLRSIIPALLLEPLRASVSPALTLTTMPVGIVTPLNVPLTMFRLFPNATLPPRIVPPLRFHVPVTPASVRVLPVFINSPVMFVIVLEDGV